MRDGFILHMEYKDMIKKLPAEEQAALIMALFDFFEGEEPGELSPAADMLFSVMSARMIRDGEKYEQIAKVRAEAGKRGGEAKPSKTKQTEANASKRKQTEAKPNKSSVPVPVLVPDKYKEKEIKEREKPIFPDDEKLEKAFFDYVQFRKDIKKPFVNRAQVERCAARLTKLSGGNNDKAISIIEQSISNGWQGLFDLKETARSGTPKNAFNDFDQRTYDFQELERQLLAR